MNKPTPYIIDLRQPAKDIVRQVLLAQEPLVLLPATLLHRAIVRAIESEAGFSYAPNFPMTQDASDVMVFYGFSESTQWSMLEEIGLSALICDEKWTNLVELRSAGDSGNSAVSPNTKPSDKSYVGIFSSGSTGQAKCIWNRLEHLKLNAMRSAKAFEVQSEHFLVFMALPWHVAGLTWAFMAEELKAEYLFVTTRKGQQALWLQTLQEFRPDYLFTFPHRAKAIIFRVLVCAQSSLWRAGDFGGGVSCPSHPLQPNLSGIWPNRSWGTYIGSQEKKYCLIRPRRGALSGVYD